MRRVDPAPTAARITQPSSNNWLQTVSERFTIFHSTNDPTVAEVPNNQWVIHKNTTTGNVFLWVNDEGVLRKVAII